MREATVATQALRQKKVYENELDSIAGRKITLETQVRPPFPRKRTLVLAELTYALPPSVQVNAIESANMNMETMNAMKKGAAVLKNIHGKLYASPQLGFVRRRRGRELMEDSDDAGTLTKWTLRWTTCARSWSLRTRSPRPFPTQRAWASTYVPACPSSAGLGANASERRSTIPSSQTSWPSWSKTSSTSDSPAQKPRHFIPLELPLLVRPPPHHRAPEPRLTPSTLAQYEHRRRRSRRTRRRQNCASCRRNWRCRPLFSLLVSLPFSSLLPTPYTSPLTSLFDPPLSLRHLVLSIAPLACFARLLTGLLGILSAPRVWEGLLRFGVGWAMVWDSSCLREDFEGRRDTHCALCQSSRQHRRRSRFELLASRAPPQL